MLGFNRKKRYSSVSFDGETVSQSASAAEDPTIDDIENDLNETEETTEDATRTDPKPKTDAESKSDSETASAAKVGQSDGIQKSDATVEASKRDDGGRNLAKVIKSKIDLENERKVKQILRLDPSHELDYSSLLSAFVILFDNFDKMRTEYGRFRKSVSEHRRVAAYSGQHGFAPSWN